MITYEKASQKFRYDSESGELVYLSGRLSGQPAINMNNRGYKRVRVDGFYHLAHRIAWLLMTGSFPSQTIDHIDGDPANNSWSNLREVSHADQQKNRSMPKANKTGVHGVSLVDGRWYAQIRDNGRVVRLGEFTDRDHAIVARQTAEILLDFHPNHGRSA